MTKGEGERFRELSRLFDDLVVLDAVEREALIESRCAGDAELERHVRALLAADSTGDSEDFVIGVVASEAASLGQPDVAGKTLGSWRILRLLAQGGMGAVYLAERADGAYEATAAIKLVRGGVLSSSLTDGFRAERQILAGLSHPGVAKLLDGGSTEDGTPYLVMEYVDGRPITDWCEDRQLGVDARLRLFLKVADTVAHAHSALVVHRDLKPSNILVAADGEPKLLDFGIAKLMDAVEDGADGITQTYRAMTPAYSSPEQISGGRVGVGSDIYALGVLLYELLAGRLPLQTRGLTPAELSKLVTEEVPPVLSAVVELGEQRRRLSGDLDAIVSRALRKEPEERYHSVEALADDIRLHLEGLPIRARRNDWSYRTGKMVRRNRGTVSAGLLMAISLVSFTLNTVIQARAVAVQRDRAEDQRLRAEQVSGFLEELLAEADPNESSGREITAREVLDRGAARVFAGMESDPETQAALATVMGRVYRSLGEYEASEPLLDSALAVRRGLSSPGDFDLGEGLLERGALAYDLGDYEEAVELSRAALAEFEREIEGDDPRTAEAMDWISVSLMELGQMEEAERFARLNVEMYRRIDPNPNEALATALVSFTDVLRGRGSFDEALEIGAEALEMSRELYGDTHLAVAHALNQMASTLTRSGRPADAVPFVEEGLAIRRAVFPEPHAETAASLGNLAGILRGLERYDEAESVRRESLAMLREIFPDEHPYIAATTFSLGDLLLEMGRPDEAREVLRQSVDQHRAVFPEAHPNLGFPLTSLGRAHLDRGEYAAAEAVLREAYSARSGGLPVRHWHVAASGLELGRALDGLGREDEAERYFTESHDILVETFGAEEPRADQARKALREHLLRRGLVDRAEELTGSGQP